MQVADAHVLNLRVVSILRLLCILVYMTHLLGCGWRLLAGLEAKAGSASWLDDVGEDQLNVLQQDVMDQYLNCLMLSLSMLMVMGRCEHLHIAARHLRIRVVADPPGCLIVIR